jgi:hypothetical protein
LVSVGSGVLSNVVDIFDVANNSWSTAALSMGRRSIATATIGNLVFFAGGEQSFSQNTPCRRVDIYNLVTGTWTTDSLSVPHDALAGAQLNNNKVFFIGGGSYMPDMVNDEVEIYMDNAAGTDESVLNDMLVISPNPTSGLVTIKNNNSIPFDFSIYNSTGQLIRSGDNMQSACSIDLRQINGNIFFIRVINGTDELTKVISVMR